MNSQFVPASHVIRDRLYELKEILISTSMKNETSKFNPRLYGLTIGKIDSVIGRKKRIDFYKAVFDAESSADLTNGQKFAIIMWAKPAPLDVQPIDAKTLWTYDRQFLIDLSILNVAIIK